MEGKGEMMLEGNLRSSYRAPLAVSKDYELHLYPGKEGHEEDFSKKS